jgi:hypothetical protein
VPAGEQTAAVLHGLATTDVVVQVWDNLGRRSEAEVTVIDADSVALAFGTPLAEPARVVVVG